MDVFAVDAFGSARGNKGDARVTTMRVETQTA